MGFATVKSVLAFIAFGVHPDGDSDPVELMRLGLEWGVPAIISYGASQMLSIFCKAGAGDAERRSVDTVLGSSDVPAFSGRWVEWLAASKERLTASEQGLAAAVVRVQECQEAHVAAQGDPEDLRRQCGRAEKALRLAQAARADEASNIAEAQQVLALLDKFLVAVSGLACVDIVWQFENALQWREVGGLLGAPMEEAMSALALSCHGAGHEGDRAQKRFRLR